MIAISDEFSALVESVRACRISELALPLGPRPALQVDPRAKILIVGQAPGRRVHESGIPFDDPSGDRLRAWRDYAPAMIPLPHPSPRNNIWLRKNPWFSESLLPSLKRATHRALNG